MAVFVLDRYQKPLMPCCEKRARKLLACGRARVHRFFPFAIRLIDRTVQESTVQPIALKADPGSKITGIAVVRRSETTNANIGEVRRSAHVLCLFDLIHRGWQISKALTARRNKRRRRRSTLRYRAPRLFNRGNKKDGWLPPSLRHRIDTTVSRFRRLCRLAPVTSIAQELVRFDMQQMENPDIAGTQYQQGTLAGYEARQYLLEKWNRTCASCGVRDVPLEVDHIHPRSKGGSNRISNLALACRPCNQAKGSCDVAVFLAKNPAGLASIQAQAKRPFNDAAAVNATRWKLFGALKATGCGGYQRTRLDVYGFPRGYLVRQKCINGFQTDDVVIAGVMKGKKVGQYRGRIAVRAFGNFNIQTPQGVVRGISHRYCRIVQRADGYGYSLVAKMDVTGTLPKQGPLRGPRSASPACGPEYHAQI